ncbi:oxysterol-binding protein-related protein 7 isoform X2 [Amblyraja radiata]|uniref:oxysterol-binding protein-related protein 7 isoform X2 n=1 Tax=Amblyraja radiata TaxID=386614 RepID=UPI0014028DF8|nr:oxysterol-binding protein-related protein 7 isoform X2 [Amblyraja radiata]
MNGDEKVLPNSQQTSPLTRSSSNASSKPTSVRQSSENWEVMEEHVGEDHDSLDLERQEGYLLKKRKWPLKGWHKRYFILEKGILKYAKTQQDILRGKLHGSINIGLSVMSINKKSKRIDLDAEENLYHLKVKSQDVFTTWVSKLCYHRLFQKGDHMKIPCGANGYSFSFPSPTAGYLCASSVAPLGSKKGGSLGEEVFKGNGHYPSASASGQTVTAEWLQQSEEWGQCNEDLSRCQLNLSELNKLLQKLELVDRVQSAPVICDAQGFLADKSKKEKRTSKIWCAQSFAKDETKAPADALRPAKLHVSAPSLPDCLDLKSSAPLSVKEEYLQLQQDFCLASKKVFWNLKSLFNTLSIEKERLKQVWAEKERDPSASAVQIANLKNTLSEVMSQNADLRNRLHGIQCLSSFVETTPSTPVKVEEHLQAPRNTSLINQLSLDSSISLSESHVEYFDAEEVMLSACSSYNEMSEDDDSTTSEITNSNSEENLDQVETDIRELTVEEAPSYSPVDGIPRRISLPAPGPNLGNVSLWNILKNNIGKDLSKVSMPVQLNEPLNTLQRLCEELEFTELLDTASRTLDPFERMVYVAAFAVSAYASAFYRARSKPFNPVLGETYECAREDKGFRFIGEQVSHHPPVSVCHAESENFLFWQDVRWKNKFWGKSLEIVPVGIVNVSLPKFGDHYQWNKVTSCIHNILSGQRWIEHYGEVAITNTTNSACHCRLTFCKTKYWSSNVNEVHGSVLDEHGRVVHQLFGKWHEGMYCGGPQSAKCIWKPKPIPKDHESCYGFTTFARELNELTPDLKWVLPLTDTRLRPDQKYLEEGNTEGAEVHKQRIEQLQRDRRRIMEENNMVYQSRFFTKTIDPNGKESWMSNGTYWELRKDPGFSKLDNPVLW